MAASPEHVFAMKALAARTRDIDDLRLLASMIGVETAETALRICTDIYLDEPIPARTEAVLRELFGELRGRAGLICLPLPASIAVNMRPTARSQR